MKKILTGIKPTGEIHLGNYVSAIQPILEMQEDKSNKIYLFIADLHSLTTSNKVTNSEDVLKAYIALGVNPKKVIIYKQSDFPEITELAWIFTCLTKLPHLQMGHAYKDMLQKKENPSTGVLLYPVLMAADIVLPDADVVPVGEDQRQHLEVARDLVRKFNVTYGDFFKEPKTMILKESFVVGTDGEKMSKSKNNTLPIFATEAELKKKIMGIVTDSVPLGKPLNPDTCNVCKLLKFVATDEEYSNIEKRYRGGSISYKEAKEFLYESFLKKFKKEREVYFKGLGYNFEKKILAKNMKKLKKEFENRIKEVKRLLGLI